MKICVMCPSRDRPEKLVEAVQSFLSTSTLADMVAYVDSDQEGMYLAALERFAPAVDRFDRGVVYRAPGESRLRVLIADRIGSVASSNRITHHYREPYTIYGMIPDDAQFLTKGWDDFLLEGELSGPVPHVVAASHNCGEYVNFPFVNRAWIEAVGWYYYPKNFHHCCDTIVEVLAECANAIDYATPEEFSMHHDQIPSMNLDFKGPDLLEMLNWLVGERRQAVRTVRSRIAEAS